MTFEECKDVIREKIVNIKAMIDVYNDHAIDCSDDTPAVNLIGATVNDLEQFVMESKRKLKTVMVEDEDK